MSTFAASNQILDWKTKIQPCFDVGGIYSSKKSSFTVAEKRAFGDIVFKVIVQNWQICLLYFLWFNGLKAREFTDTKLQKPRKMKS